MPLFSSIRFKMLGVVVALTALLSLAFFQVGKDTYANYKALQISHYQSLAAEETARVEAVIQGLEANVRELALVGELLFQVAPERILQSARYAVLHNFRINTEAVGGGIWYRPYLFGPARELACFYAYWKDGETVFDESFAGPEYHYPTQPWYLDGKQHLETLGTHPGREIVWSRPYVDATGTRALMTTVSGGIYDRGGAFLGLATVDWRLDDIARRIAAMRPTANSIILFADAEHDLILALSDPAETRDVVGLPLETLPWFDKEAPPERSLQLKGEAYCSFFMEMSNGMSLTVNVPEAELFHEINQALGMTLLSLAGFMALAAGLTWGLLNRFVGRPVAALSRAAAEVGAGNLEASFPVRSRDELGELARSFSGMTRSLQCHIEHLGAVTAEKERIEAELHIARDIQASMLPSTFPPFPERPECDLRAFMLPAKEVGGDFYDFFFIDEHHLAVVIADVSDKGVPAALFMVIAKTLIRNNALGRVDPGDVLAATNAQLCENNATAMFVTACMGVLDVRSGLFRYANAGHTPFFVQRPGEAFRRITLKPALPLAVMEETLFSTETLCLAPGETVFFYTDGVTEAGLEKALAGHERRLPGDLRGFIEGVKESLDAFVRGARQNDDITMLALTYTGPETADRGGDFVRAARFPARIEALPECMALVEEALAAGPFSERQRMRFAVAVEEMFVNIASYAYAGCPTPEPTQALVDVCLELKGKPALLLVRLIDAGRPFNPLERELPDISLPAEEREPGGLGIFMAGRGTDAVAYECRDGKNIVTMTLRAEQPSDVETL